jgi:glycosyltransferase XagB
MPVDDELVYRARATAAGLAYLRLEAGSVDAAAARLVPAELARSLDFVPVATEGDAVVVATPDPARTLAQSAVRGFTGRAVRLAVATPRRIRLAQSRVYGPPPVLAPERFAPAPRAAGAETLELPGLEPAVARTLGERTSRLLGVVALHVDGDTVAVAAAAPLDDETARLLEAILGRTPVATLAPAAAIELALDRVFGGSHARGAATDAPRVRLPSTPGRRLGELLVASGALDAGSVRAALAVQRRTGDRLGHILLSLGYLRPEGLAQALADQLRLPYVEPRRAWPRDGAAVLPESLCRRHRLLPLEVVGGELVVALADPLDPEARAALAEATALPTRIVVASDTAIASGLERLYSQHYVELSTTELLRRRPDESAHVVLTGRQKAALALGAVLLALGAAVAPTRTLVLLMLLSVLFYTVSSVYKFVLIYRTIGHEPELPVSETEVALLDERLLPRYTILVPLYDEAEVLPGLVRALDGLDYPPTRLDVKLLLEADDLATIRAARRLPLGPHYDLVVVPPSEPRTKPKACNYGLLRARGDYVVIFDAEDRPEPDQLKKAVVAFRKAPRDVACVQAKLNYWNRDQNLLTRWFTTEYSQWFDLFLPGLDASGAPIPLGGTSNHFVLETLLELGAWDPFNVTEDADVGIRLSRRGLRTTMIDSTTYEEANSRLYNWIRQRSRWVKGYIQTWLVHMRHPVRLWRELGPANFLSFQLVVGGTFLTMLLNPLFWGLTTLWALTEAGFIREMFPGIVYFAGGFNLLVGNFVFTYLSVAGTMRRGYSELVKYALFSPLYWALMSIGAWKGLAQLVTRPSYWEKTTHGLSGEAVG